MIIDKFNLAKIMVVIMFMEMAIFLAVYKDVIFAFVTEACYVGMYIYKDNDEVDETLIILIAITGTFILITLIFDYDKAFYLKYKMFYI